MPKSRVLPNPTRQRSLMLHLGLAAASLGETHFKNREAMDDSFWTRPASRTVRASMEKVIDGLRLYQLHPYHRKPVRESVIWIDGQVRLIWHAARGRTAPKARILLVPSMINGTEILDIMPERSLIAWLTAQGIDVYLLDWGDLRRDPEVSNLDSVFSNKILPMLKFLSGDSNLPLYGLGYCMGGLLLAAMERLHANLFAGLCFVATPWDFRKGAKGTFAGAVQKWAKDGLGQVRLLNYMPADWLQMIFAGVDAGLIARKYSAFSAMDQTTEEARLFVAVEDWVNGGADLPAGIIQDSVGAWYQQNLPCKGQWKVLGKKICAETIDKSCLVIVPGRDKIVPPDSARALFDLLPSADLLEPDCGHISMMVGRNAETMVWKYILAWLKKDLKNPVHRIKLSPR